jgi:hypothetical protein
MDERLSVKISKYLHCTLISLPGLLMGSITCKFIFEPITDVACRWQASTPVCSIRESNLFWQKKKIFYPLFDSSESSYRQSKYGTKYSKNGTTYSDSTLYFVNKRGETQKIGEFKSEASTDMGRFDAELFLKTNTAFSSYTWQEDTSGRKIFACFLPGIIVIMVGNGLKVLKSK